MRLSGWMVALAALVMVLMTGVCAFSAYGLAYQFVLDSEGNLPLPDLRPQPRVAVAATPVPTDALAAPTSFIDTTDTTNATDAPPASGAGLPPGVVPTVTRAPRGTSAGTNSAQATSPDALALAAQYQLNDPRRITVLLLGIDQRSAVESADTEYFRTDTMILVQLDPVRRTIGMVSIPRDLYVDIPGMAVKERINTANSWGDANAYPGGGPALAMETVRRNLGVRVDNYVLVNFDVFTTVVDALAPSGVQVCVEERIVDDKYPDAGYGTLRVTFEPGCQRLGSERLLQYARTRATQGSDFDRARRQQQVILAVRDEVISAGGVARALAQAPRLWADLADNLRTDMTFERAMQIALAAADVDRASITTASIGTNVVTFGTTPSGEDVLIPNAVAIASLIDQTFNPEPDLTLEQLAARAASERASIAVLNNSDVPGLATLTRDRLAAQGITVASLGNTPTPDNRPTYIRDNTGNPWTARYLAALLNVPPERIISGSDGTTSNDVAVVLGPDAATP